MCFIHNHRHLYIASHTFPHLMYFSFQILQALFLNQLSIAVVSPKKKSAIVLGLGLEQCGYWKDLIVTLWFIF